MLLEYNVDTKDENMNPKAIEIRRRFAERNLAQSIEDGHTTADGLLTLKQMNCEERKDHIKESNTILMADVNARVSVARAQQQLEVQSKVRSLERDVSRASRLNKASVDALTDLQDRIKVMRAQLKESIAPPVETVISRDLRASNKQVLDSEFAICKKCNKRIVLQLINSHENMCSFARSADGLTVEDLHERVAVYRVDQDIVTSIATFTPQPPRNCQVVNKGATFIQWAWEPPVIDGGLVVTEYEMSFIAKITEFDKNTGRYNKFEERCLSMKTSQWFYTEEPVCNYGFRMTQLRANTEYTDFKIRCMNLRGWSPWVDMLLKDEYDDVTGSSSVAAKKSGGSDWHQKMDNEGGAQSAANMKKMVLNTSVFTLPPDVPSMPLYLTCTQVTSSCIHINWQTPHYDGGSEVVDYIVHYTELEKQVTVTSRDVIREHVKKFRVHSGAVTSAVIRNIFPDSDVVRVYVEAVTKVGMVGDKAHLKFNGISTLHTSKSCRFSQLSREMAVAAASSEMFVDSSFFNGVKQRLLRVDYMRKVQEELSVTVQDPLELDEAKEWAAILEAQQVKVKHKAELERLANEATVIDNDSIEYNDDGTMVETKHNYEFTFRQRRMHYKRKIQALEVLLADLYQERVQIDKNRLIYTMEMKGKEKRLMAYKLEYERLKHYTGNTVTSSVLTGSNMQYKIADYRLKIDAAFDIVINEISGIKYKVIMGENRRMRIKTEMDTAESFKKDRHAKFLEFDNNYQKTLMAMERLNLNGDQSVKLMTHYFKLLKNYKLYRQRKREQVTSLFEHVIFRYKKSAFTKWRSGNFYFSSNDTQNFISVGSILLQQSEEKRIELQGLLRGVIAETASIKQSLELAKVSRDTKKKLVTSVDFKQMEEGRDHFDVHSKGMHFLYEGDGYAIQNKFQQAKHNYEAQIWFLRSRPNGVDIKMLAICHGRMGKMFLRLGKKNRAIVEFDRQLSLAKEIADKPEEAEAYFGLGSGYLDAYDYDNAIRYLSIAAALLDALCNGPKYCGALMALKECYSRLGKDDKVALYTDKISLIENDLKNKLVFMGNKLDEMKTRLVTTAAEIEHVINIERITNKALNIKRTIEKHNRGLEEMEANVEKQEALIGTIEMLMDAIATELKAAIDCDDGAMLSNLVHDQPQVIEIEELKMRLNARSASEMDRLTVEKEALRRMQVLVKNTENDIQEEDQMLILENGALMRHSRLDKPFRCIGLCQSNVAGNEVTGTATGGYEVFSAAEGVNVHLIDYHSGELVHIYVGGVDGQVDVGHTGVVTCLCHDGNYLYSGATDELIICWNTITQEKFLVMRGHEGTVVSLAVETTMLVSGGADATLRLWNKHNGEQLRVIFGHSKSVLSIEIGPTWLLTGGADHEVRVWKITSKNRHSSRADCTYRMMGHDCAVTCVRYGKMEILSADVQGRIFIWWMSTGEIIRRCQVHKGPVKCMQFDSVHIVSGGVDNIVAITDIATGEVLQKLYGHTGHVLALAFDSERILSTGGDNTVRYWQWGKKSGPTDKYHVFDKGETLLAVSKLHGLSLEELMRWNGITEMKQTYTGMKLLVRKGDPEVLTDAERVAVEREKKRQAGLVLTGKKFKETNVSLLGGENSMDYDRVHKLATDIDFYSLGNRMFGREKRQLELFPDTFNANANSKSLASRLQHPAGDPLGELTDIAASKVKPRYFVSADNEDEWGEVADTLGVTMLSMLVEYAAYEVVMERKKALRSTQSVIGRVNAYQQKQIVDKAKAEAAALKLISDGGAEVSADGSTSLLLLPPIEEDLEASQDLESSTESGFGASPSRSSKDQAGIDATEARRNKHKAKKAERQDKRRSAKIQREVGLDPVLERDEDYLEAKSPPSATSPSTKAPQSPSAVLSQSEKLPAVGVSVSLPVIKSSLKPSVIGEGDGSSSVKKKKKNRSASVEFTLPPI